MIQAELDRLGIRLEAVDDAQALADVEARAYFKAHRATMLRLGSVAVRVIVVADQAEALLRESADSPVEKFGRLASRRSLDVASQQKDGLIGSFDHVSARDLNDRFGRTVAALVFALRHTGEVGFARADNGQYVVVRAEEVRLKEESWNVELAHRARNHLVLERRQRALDDLDRRLRAAAKIHVDENALSRIPVVAVPNLTKS